MALASANPNQHRDRISGLTFYAYYGPWSLQHKIGVISEGKQGKSDWRFHFSCGNINGMDEAEMAGAGKEVKNDIPCIPIISESSHRDGAIYRCTARWKDDCIDIADRRQTRLEPMRLLVATECHNDPDYCIYHIPCDMLQIFSLKLTETPVNRSTIQLYGYMAARDEIDSMLNYVFHHSRDDPVILEQGSVIEMTGPKRGIALADSVIFEFDMRIKNGEQEDDDLQLIDGAVVFNGLRMLGVPFHGRIQGSSGAVDMCATLVQDAVEATVEIVISDVQSSFDLSLSSVFSAVDVPEEFHLFLGTIGDSCGLRRFVIAVKMNTEMHLKFNVRQKGSNSNNIEHCCSFKAKLHGYASHQIKLELASILVKVTWATLFVE
ncbi:unnamed protein product [Urochloa humidicola]